MSLAEAPAAIGHNNPPPSPFEAVSAHLTDLQTEARHWLDGAQVASQAEADKIGLLLDELRKGKKAADDARKLEAKPFDDAKAEVQARYNPLLKAADIAADGCKAALAPWLRRIEDEKRAVAEAARKEAERKAAEAAEAMRQAQSTDLAAREAAEALVAEAKRAERDASRAENDKAHATGGARAVALRSYWTPIMVDGVAAARHFWVTDRAACEAFFQSLAVKAVAAGHRAIPGFEVTEERRPV